MIVVTGGTGFIGSNLLAGLQKAIPTEPLVAVDWLGQGDKWHNIANRTLGNIIAPENMFTFLNHNVRKLRAIFHMGATSSTLERDGDLIFRNNFQLSHDLWEWCAQHHVRLIYASSAATYGAGEHGFDDDETEAYLNKLQPMNLYGWSKNIFDRWVAQQKKLRPSIHPPQCVGLKFFNVYGPNEYHKGNQRSLVHQIFPSAARGETFQLFKSHRKDYADGGQLRDFVYVADVVDIMVWLYNHPRVNGLFNIGTGKARSFADLAAAVYKATGKEPMIAYRDMPAELQNQYQYFTQAKMDKLHAAGYTKPPTTLEDGVAHYVQEYLMKAYPYI